MIHTLNFRRILCLLLAVLFLCVSVFRPIEASASSIVATASVVGITVESAIPWLLSALSVSYLGASASELYPKIKTAISEWIYSVGYKDYIKAYFYDNKYCFSSDVLSKVTTVSDTYLADKYNTNGYANMVAIDWYDTSGVSYSYVCFSNNTPQNRIF